MLQMLLFSILFHGLCILLKNLKTWKIVEQINLEQSHTLSKIFQKRNG